MMITALILFLLSSAYLYGYPIAARYAAVDSIMLTKSLSIIPTRVDHPALIERLASTHPYSVTIPVHMALCMGLMSVGLAYYWDFILQIPESRALSFTVIASALVTLAALDARTTYLNVMHSLLITAVLLTLAYADMHPLGITFHAAFFGGAIASSLIVFANRLTKNSASFIASGDIAFVAGLGGLVGFKIVVVLLVAVVMQLVFQSVLARVSAMTEGKGAPFGPALLFATFAVTLFTK